MKHIVIEVDENTAKKWQAATSEIKAELSRLIEQQISNKMDKKTNEDPISYFDALREEMAQKGLTQEILDDILKANA